MRFYEIFYTYTFGTDNFFGTKKAAFQYACKRAKENCPNYSGKTEDLIRDICPLTFLEKIRVVWKARIH